MTQIPGNELIGAAIAVSVIAGLTGSASGGQAIALPLVAPHYLDQGVEPDQLYRICLYHQAHRFVTSQWLCGYYHTRHL